MIDYKAIARAIKDPENQPHQWGEEALEGMFISAVDEIERLREALKEIADSYSPDYDDKIKITMYRGCIVIARAALKEKE